MNYEDFDFEEDLTEAERWVKLEENPEYSVSNHGRFRNDKRDSLVRVTPNNYGVARVGLYTHPDGQTTYSCHLLVAKYFVPNHYPANYDSVILLDGDHMNVRADNLAWRPRWFAKRYTNQFKNVQVWNQARPVYDLATAEIYENVEHAAKVNGLLMSDVLSSCVNEYERCNPSGQKFAYYNEADWVDARFP